MDPTRAVLTQQSELSMPTTRGGLIEFGPQPASSRFIEDSHEQGDPMDEDQPAPNNTVQTSDSQGSSPTLSNIVVGTPVSSDGEEDTPGQDNMPPSHGTTSLPDPPTVPAINRSERRSSTRWALLFGYIGTASAIAACAEPVEPKNVKQARDDPMWKEWKKAMKDEVGSLQKNKTWTLVNPPTNRRILRGKWVFKAKRGANGEIVRYKARWVVRGFEQEEGVDYLETFAAVVKPMTYKIMFAIAAALGLEIEQMDVKTAFLYSDIDEEIYVEQPTRMDDGSGRVCRLNKALYGLKQSPRLWYETLATYLKSLGFTPLSADMSVFVRGQTYIAVYVDDLLIIGPSTEEIRKVKGLLSDRFQMTDLGPCHYYLGMTVTRDRSKRQVRLSQRAYIERILKDFGMQDCKPMATPMETKAKLEPAPDDYTPSTIDRTRYAQLIGHLMYVMLGTRPDIAFPVSVLSRFMAKPTKKHIGAAKRVLRYLKATLHHELIFEGDLEALVGYTDSDWAGDTARRRSTAGYVFNLGSGAVSWQAKRQSVVALSSCEAEFMGQTQATKEAVWLRRLLQEVT